MIADAGTFRIRRISEAGAVTTIIGQVGTPGFALEGHALKDAAITYAWTVTAALPGLGEKVLGRGRCHFGEKVAGQCRLPEAGTCELRLTLVSDAGVTLHDSRTLTVEP